jgi:AcrR family transcriptional regulator
LARYDSEREAIMRAAYRLIGREGGSVSVQEILDSAGLSTRAFYRHFASKDELVLSMYRTDNQRVADALWAATEEEPDAWRALQAWVAVSLSVVFDKGRERHSRVLGSPEAKSAAGWSQEFLDGVAREMASLEAVLARGAGDGTFRSVRVEADAQVIFGATNNFASLHIAGGPDVVQREQALDAVVQAARRMLGVGYESGSTSRASARREASP